MFNSWSIYYRRPGYWWFKGKGWWRITLWWMNIYIPLKTNEILNFEKRPLQITLFVRPLCLLLGTLFCLIIEIKSKVPLKGLILKIFFIKSAPIESWNFYQPCHVLFAHIQGIKSMPKLLVFWLISADRARNMGNSVSRYVCLPALSSSSSTSLHRIPTQVPIQARSLW